MEGKLLEEFRKVLTSWRLSMNAQGGLEASRLGVGYRPWRISGPTGNLPMLTGSHSLRCRATDTGGGFGLVVNIRKFVVRAARLQDLVELGSLTEQAAVFLEMAVTAGLSIVVAGVTQAGDPANHEDTRLDSWSAVIGGCGV